jgi:hypothetical protein
MTPKEYDTDPSTPAARRVTDEHDEPPPAEPRPTPVRSSPPLQAARTSTDPGVAPPAAPRGPSERPMGIVVPAAARDGKKDSVELLLDGMMTTPQPERTKVKPQTDGEASASYHARHDVRAARTSPDDVPSVIVERAVLPPTLHKIRIDGGEEPPLRSAPARPAPAPTANLPPRLGPRVVMAVVAGALVVLILVIGLRASFQRGTFGTAPAPTSPAQPGAERVELPPPAAASAQPPAPPPSDGVASPIESAPAPVPPLPRRTAPSASSGRTRAKPAPPASAALDGELKTTFR